MQGAGGSIVQGESVQNATVEAQEKSDNSKASAAVKSDQFPTTMEVEEEENEEGEDEGKTMTERTTRKTMRKRTMRKTMRKRRTTRKRRAMEAAANEFSPLPGNAASDGVDDPNDGTAYFSPSPPHAFPQGKSYVRPTVDNRENLREEWTLEELKLLNAAKKETWMVTQISNGANFPIHFANRDAKWENVAQYLWEEAFHGLQDPIRDGPSCEKMWKELIGDWKKIHFHEMRIRPGSKPYRKMNVRELRQLSLPLSYRTMSPNERRRMSLPLDFDNDLLVEIALWYPGRDKTRRGRIRVMDTDIVNRGM